MFLQSLELDHEFTLYNVNKHSQALYCFCITAVEVEKLDPHQNFTVTYSDPNGQDINAVAQLEAPICKDYYD